MNSINVIIKDKEVFSNYSFFNKLSSDLQRKILMFILDNMFVQGAIIVCVSKMFRGIVNKFQNKLVLRYGVNNNNINTISFLTNLKGLNFSYCKNFTDSSIELLCNNVQNLKSICLCSCNNITSKGINLLVESFPDLVCLDLSSLAILTDDDVINIVNKCRKLEKLSLFYCRNITDKSVKVIGEKCDNMLKLCLSYCSRITHEGVQALGNLKLEKLSLMSCVGIVFTNILWERFTNLKKLDLSNNKISDNGIQVLTLLTNLECLYIRCCYNITTDGVVALSIISSLKLLELYGCSNITNSGIGSLKFIERLKCLYTIRNSS